MLAQDSVSRFQLTHCTGDYSFGEGSKNNCQDFYLPDKLYRKHPQLQCKYSPLQFEVLISWYMLLYSTFYTIFLLQTQMSEHLSHIHNEWDPFYLPGLQGFSDSGTMGETGHLQHHSQIRLTEFNSFLFLMWYTVFFFWQAGHELS